MGVAVHIPGALREFSAKKAAVKVAPGKVGEILHALGAIHPGVLARVVDETGRVRQHVNIFVGAENIRDLNGLETRVSDGSEVFILPAVTGGSEMAWSVPAGEWAAVLMSLFTIVAASSGIFWLLVRRWTAQRHWLALQDWADNNRFKLHGEKKAIDPGILKNITQPSPKVLISLNDVDTGIVQIEANPPKSASGQPHLRWNLLVRKLERTWPTTGFRPVANNRSILDYFPLNEMRAMAPTERFILYGAESRAARSLGKSSVAALLPPDVGMLLVEQNLVLDFSSRPFDPLELQRVDALAEQIVVHLPSA